MKYLFSGLICLLALVALEINAKPSKVEESYEDYDGDEYPSDYGNYSDEADSEKSGAVSGESYDSVGDYDEYDESYDNYSDEDDIPNSAENESSPEAGVINPPKPTKPLEVAPILAPAPKPILTPKPQPKPKASPVPIKTTVKPTQKATSKKIVKKPAPTTKRPITKRTPAVVTRKVVKKVANNAKKNNNQKKVVATKRITKRSG